MLDRVSTLHSSSAGTWNGARASDSEVGKQVHCGNQIRKTKGTDHRSSIQCKDTEEMALRCGSSSLESDPVDLVNMILHVWDSFWHRNLTFKF
jgi:hypothetical protein